MGLGIVAALFVVAAPAVAQASPQDVLGYGARSSAMAGTGVASAESYEAVFKNPALLSLASDAEIDLGMVGVVFDLKANGPFGTDGMAAATLGGALPIPLPDPIGNRVVLGFGFLTPFDVVVRSRILYPETPQFLLPDRVESIAAQVGLGVDIGWGFRVGLGFEALAALKGTVLVATDATGALGAVVQDTLVASYAPVAGVSYEFLDDWRVGLGFHGVLEGRFDVRIDLKDLGQLTVPPIFVSGTAQYDPMSLEVELARITGPVKAALALGWRRWSQYPGLAEATIRCPLDVTTFYLPSCGALRPVAADFNDTIVVRGGVEGTIVAQPGVDLDLRGGYSFESAPAPEATGESNLFEEARSTLTAGFGVNVYPPITAGFRMDTFAQFGILHGRTHEKGPDVDPSNAGQPSVETGGTLLAGGTAVGVAF